MRKHLSMLLVIIVFLGLSIGYSALNTNLSISGEALVEKEKIYTEDILNGTDPILQDELIPVTIENNGTVRKADIYSEWYNYGKQKWANAVILTNAFDNLSENGQIHGTTNTKNGLIFDGVDDYVDLGMKNYDFKNQITMMVKVEVDTNNQQEILSNSEAAGSSILIYKNRISFQIHNGEEQKYNLISGPEIEVGEIYTIIGTYDGKKQKLYVNGDLVSSASLNTSITVSNTPIVIGANPQVSGNHNSFFKGKVYQAVVFNRALLDEEIEPIEKGKIMDNTGLLSYVNFVNKEYNAGDIIPEENIESYFVWIPRFKYKIFDEGNYSELTEVENAEQTIEIIFEDKNTPVSNGTKVGEWLTHPAFTSFNSNGMWIGKFETGTILTSDYNVRNGNAVQIKPNTTSWRNIQVSNAFYTSYDYKRNLDSHMMKNTEWGAVAYFQHSIYGSRTSVRINNNSNFITGYASINEPTCGYSIESKDCNSFCSDGSCNSPYNTITGYLASTTGNISGIYDMNGGTIEYVMGVLTNSNGKPFSGRSNKYNSGFNGKVSCPECDDSSGITEVTNGYDMPIKKYYDSYIYSSSQTNYNLRIPGDATGEMGPFTNKTRKISSWYDDEATFVNYEAPWFVRGGVLNGYNSGSNGGIFAFARGYGSASTFSVTPTFRIVLTPNN